MKQEQWEGLSPENRMLGLLRLRRDETEWIHRHIEGLNHPKRTRKNPLPIGVSWNLLSCAKEALHTKKKCAWDVVGRQKGNKLLPRCRSSCGHRSLLHGFDIGNQCGHMLLEYLQWDSVENPKIAISKKTIIFWAAGIPDAFSAKFRFQTHRDNHPCVALTTTPTRTCIVKTRIC